MTRQDAASTRTIRHLPLAALTFADSRDFFRAAAFR